MKNQKIEMRREKVLNRGKQSILFFCLFIFLLLLALALKYLWGVQERQMWPLLVVLGIDLLYGIYIQFSIKCPYCGFRLGSVARLGVPSVCPKCKGKIKKT